MRVQRAVARAGITSRRKAEALVAAGRVVVNGAPAHIGQVVDPDADDIRIDGRKLPRQALPEWWVLHKPPGVLVTRRDARGRRTVFDLLPERPGLTYVGRLDYLTEGVLLFTTDGAAAHALTHPSREVERTYAAVVRGRGDAAARAIRRGVMLDDGEVNARDVHAAPLGGGRWEITLTITEGRNREVRRLCEAVGLEVERLVRTRYGPIALGTLPAGEARKLTRRELDAIAGVMAG
ncbi:MAG TPA: pseudouridine synthase [Gemmatimonadaceae bacterium]|nr:pseudouridine synthase [Gemmatimonadaceae bacterium]